MILPLLLVLSVETNYKWNKSLFHKTALTSKIALVVVVRFVCGNRPQERKNNICSSQSVVVASEASLE